MIADIIEEIKKKLIINDSFHSFNLIFLFTLIFFCVMYQLISIRKIICAKFFCFFKLIFFILNCIFKYSSMSYFFVTSKLNCRKVVTNEDIVQKTKIKIETELETINELQIVTTSKFKKINLMEGFFLFNNKQKVKKT